MPISAGPLRHHVCKCGVPWRLTQVMGFITALLRTGGVSIPNQRAEFDVLIMEGAKRRQGMGGRLVRHCWQGSLAAESEVRSYAVKGPLEVLFASCHWGTSDSQPTRLEGK